MSLSFLWEYDGSFFFFLHAHLMCLKVTFLTGVQPYEGLWNKSAFRVLRYASTTCCISRVSCCATQGFVLNCVHLPASIVRVHWHAIHVNWFHMQWKPTWSDQKEGYRSGEELRERSNCADTSAPTTMACCCFFSLQIVKSEHKFGFFYYVPPGKSGTRRPLVRIFIFLVYSNDVPAFPSVWRIWCVLPAFNSLPLLFTKFSEYSVFSGAF